MPYLFAFVLLYVPCALSYDINILELNLTGNPNNGVAGWNGYYHVEGGYNPAQDVAVPNCYQGCVIGVGPYLPSGADRGVIGRYNIANAVNVPAWATWSDAILAYTHVHHNAGSVWHDPSHMPNPGVPVRLSDLCFTFITVDKLGIVYGAPGTTCNRARPAPISCDIILPSSLDLGVVSLGARGTRGSVDGSASCSGVASLRIRLLNSPSIDGRTIKLNVNGLELSASDTPVGRGTSVSLNVSALIEQPLDHAGLYMTDAVFAISYD